METTGTVIENMPNEMYRVELKGGSTIVAHIGKEMRMHFTRILPGDEVTIELSETDHSRGRILRRKR